MVETGHVLFLDLVGYSKLSLELQAAQVAHLLAIVRSSHAFQRAESNNELLRVASGDGIALVFFRFPEAPARCALEIQEAVVLKNMALRMGIHFGPVTRTLDINHAETVTGSGINVAKRVMDAASPNEILLSSAAAAVLSEYTEFAERVKHSQPIQIQAKHNVQLTVFRFGEKSAPDGLRAAGASAGSASGGLPIHTDLYVQRSADFLFFKAIERRDSIVLIKGARQMGKTSLLARGLHQARQKNTRVVVIDFQALSETQLASTEALYKTIAETIADALDLEIEDWRESRAPNTNLERFLRRTVFAAHQTPLILGLDEVDRLFACSFGSEVFGLFRSWHNRRSLDPDGPWHCLTLAIAYATEAHLFISDPNQSPFNVGTRLELSDFTEAEVETLNQRCGSPLAQTRPLYDLLSGQPYLTRHGLDVLTETKADFMDFAESAVLESGPFGEHLRRLLFAITQDALLTESVHSVLHRQPITHLASFYRLRAAGVIVGESPQKATLRCQLYQYYLKARL
jgi:hypothetical protein